MGRVTVKFHQPMAEIIKIDETCYIETEETVTFKELLTRLENAYGKGIRKALLEPGESDLQGYIIVLVNGYRINRVEAKIHDGSIVEFFPVVFGG